MPPPLILVNSSSGSDTAASGAGPSTALTGTNASTSATGLVVTLDGSPDLTNVATDGTHVIFLNDSTANVRNFGAITAKDDMAKTVTVSDAFRASATGLSWAIGGKRASVAGSISNRLWTTSANGAGDAMPGWTVRMESGHSESGGQITFRRAGTIAEGFITLEGDPSASTRPVYTSSANGASMVQTFIRLRNFNLRKSGTSGSTAVISSAQSVIQNCRVLDNSGVKFATGIDTSGATACLVENNYIETVTGVGILINIEAIFRFNVVLGCGSFGMHVTGPTTRQPTIQNNIIANGSSDGIRVANTSDSTMIAPLLVASNTIHNNAGDGIEFESSSTQRCVFQQLFVESNQITKNGGVGIRFSGSSVTDELISRLGGRITCNNFGTGSTANTSGDCNLTLTTSGADNLGVDPGYADAANNNYSIGASTVAKAFPLTAIGAAFVAGNISYADIGAVQRQPASGGGGAPLIGRGGLVY